jgi:hypothetical protein
MSKNYSVEDSDRDDFTNFEKFSTKNKDKKDKKRSLRDHRGNDDKRKFNTGDQQKNKK